MMSRVSLIGGDGNNQSISSTKKFVPILPQPTRRYVWMFSQFHAKVVFQQIQILLLLCSLSSLVCISGISLPQCPSFKEWIYPIVYCCAIATFFSVLLAFAGMRYCDVVHRTACRVWKHPFPPIILLLPSYMVQIGVVLVFGLWMIHRIFEEYYYIRATSNVDSITSDIIISIGIPSSLVWLTIFYFLVASFDYAFYASRKSRYWHRPPPRPVILTRCNYSFGPRQDNSYSGPLRNFKDSAPISASFGGSSAILRNSSEKQIAAERSTLSKYSNESEKIIKECIQVLSEHVTPIKHQLPTVYEETISQKSDKGLF